MVMMTENMEIQLNYHLGQSFIYFCTYCTDPERTQVSLKIIEQVGPGCLFPGSLLLSAGHRAPQASQPHAGELRAQRAGQPLAPGFIFLCEGRRRESPAPLSSHALSLVVAFLFNR